MSLPLLQPEEEVRATEVLLDYWRRQATPTDEQDPWDLTPVPIELIAKSVGGLCVDYQRSISDGRQAFAGEFRRREGLI
ncbi:MAG: hypothetical protein ACREID_05205, partial [Planctomycetota bacterium]